METIRQGCGSETEVTRQKAALTARHSSKWLLIPHSILLEHLRRHTVAHTVVSHVHEWRLFVSYEAVSPRAYAK